MRGRIVALLVVLLVVLSGCAEHASGPDTVPAELDDGGSAGNGGGDGGTANAAGDDCVEPGRQLSEVRNCWRQTRSDNAPMGVNATLSLSGTTVTVKPDTDARASATLANGSIRPAAGLSSDERILLFRNATVPGHGTGLLAVRTGRLHVRNGTVTVPLERIRAENRVTVVPKTDSETGPDGERVRALEWSAAGEVANFSAYVDADVAGLRVAGYERAVLATEDGRTELEGPVTVDANGLWWRHESGMSGARVSVSAARFSVGLTEPSGTVDRTDGESIAAPYTVHGRRGRFVVTPERVESDGAFRLTQAVTDDGAALDAAVQVVPHRVTVEAPRDSVSWVKVSYREYSYTGDAVYADATVTGNGSHMVSVPTSRPPLFVSEVLNVVPRDSVAAPARAIILLPVALSAPFEAFARMVNCAVTGCPAEHPYPSWIGAGEVGTFYYAVNTTGVENGSYAATIHLEGTNYDTVGIPVEIYVGNASTDPRAGTAATDGTVGADVTTVRGGPDTVDADSGPTDPDTMTPDTRVKTEGTREKALDTDTPPPTSAGTAEAERVQTTRPSETPEPVLDSNPNTEREVDATSGGPGGPDDIDDQGGPVPSDTDSRSIPVVVLLGVGGLVALGYLLGRARS